MFEKILGREVMTQINPAIEEILAMEEPMNPDMVNVMVSAIRGATSAEQNQETVDKTIESFRKRGFDANAAIQLVSVYREDMLKEVNALELKSEDKIKILNSIVDSLLQPFQKAAETVDGASLTVGWLKTSAQAVIPTYAHPTDACADLYAIKDQKIAKHACGEVVHTGLRANIPDGWFLEIRSRSGMAAKTPLRIANSVGTIDSGYKGEIMVLFDNISGKDYEIKAGDRIAQIRPVRAEVFRSTEVADIGTSDRGEGGLGSTGQ